MSNNYQDWEDDDFDLEDESEQPRRAENNNDLVRQLRKAQRAADKRAKDLESELLSLRSAQRENVIKSVLESKGLNPKVAKFIPADIETTDESINQWINEYGDVFGLAPQQNQSSSPDLATLRQIDAVTQGAVTPDKIENLLLRLDQADSAEDIINMIHGSN